MRMPSSSRGDVPAERPERAGRPRLRRESSADQVAAHVRQLIMAGELRKGDRLRQDEIADQLGVSRIPVREAIIALDREGWVRFEANRGAFVTGLGADDIRDHYELRGYVLGLTAKRVAETATDEELADLGGRFRAMQNAEDVATFSSLNEGFLARLLRIADSPRLRAALLVTPSILPNGFFDVVPAGRKVQTDGLRQLVRLLKARRGDDADHVMRTTLRQHGRRGGRRVRPVRPARRGPVVTPARTSTRPPSGPAARLGPRRARAMGRRALTRWPATSAS